MHYRIVKHIGSTFRDYVLHKNAVPVHPKLTPVEFGLRVSLGAPLVLAHQCASTLTLVRGAPCVYTQVFQHPGAPWRPWTFLPLSFTRAPPKPCETVSHHTAFTSFTCSCTIPEPLEVPPSPGALWIRPSKRDLFSVPGEDRPLKHV